MNTFEDWIKRSYEPGQLFSWEVLVAELSKYVEQNIKPLTYNEFTDRLADAENNADYALSIAERVEDKLDNLRISF